MTLFISVVHFYKTLYITPFILLKYCNNFFFLSHIHISTIKPNPISNPKKTQMDSTNLSNQATRIIRGVGLWEGLNKKWVFNYLQKLYYSILILSTVTFCKILNREALPVCGLFMWTLAITLLILARNQSNEPNLNALIIRQGKENIDAFLKFQRIN